mmetsp:Transcript_16165/g.61638  ORF Transcript_16165/g.61638 Transcript_16165/m.61638 type:complete len:250 (-) Transcript_16165:941-1690(-)
MKNFGAWVLPAGVRESRCAETSRETPTASKTWRPSGTRTTRAMWRIRRLCGALIRQQPPRAESLLERRRLWTTNTTLPRMRQTSERPWTLSRRLWRSGAPASSASRTRSLLLQRARVRCRRTWRTSSIRTRTTGRTTFCRRRTRRQSPSTTMKTPATWTTETRIRKRTFQFARRRAGAARSRALPRPSRGPSRCPEGSRRRRRRRRSRRPRGRCLSRTRKTTSTPSLRTSIRTRWSREDSGSLRSPLPT